MLKKQPTPGIRGIRSRCANDGPEPKMLTLRLPKGMYSIIAKIAEEQQVSMNSLGIRFLWQGISGLQESDQFDTVLNESKEVPTPRLSGQAD